MKAADIPDTTILDAVQSAGVGSNIGAMFSMIAERFPGVPEKVVRAKLHALLRRHLVTGCVCGCRGDFTLTSKGLDLLHA